MEPHISTRRRALAALSMTVLLLLVPYARAGAHTRAEAEGAQAAPRLCDIPWNEGRGKVKDLITCVARRWRVPGGPEKAIDVAKCESGLRPKALNPTGCAGYGCEGLFQAHMHYWHDWWARWVRKFGLPPDPYDGRSNTIWAIRMAHVQGWGPWGCA